MGSAPFVPRGDHRDALGKEQGGEEIPALLQTQLPDLRIVAWAFHAVIPGVIVIVAVAVFFAVRFVMFVVVADEIVQGESVVGRDEVDARIGTAPVVLVEVRTSR